MKKAILLLLICLLATNIFAVSFTDSLGRVTELPKELDRIVPSGNLAQLVLYSVAPERIVGWSSRISETAAKYFEQDVVNLPVFGTFYGKKANLNKEALMSAAPDVVIDMGEIKGTKEEMAKELDDLQHDVMIPVIFIEAYLDNTPDVFRTLGKFLDEEEKCEKLAVFAEEALNMAEEARDQAANSTDYESNARANLVGFMNEFIADLSGGSSGGGTEEPEVPADTTAPTVNIAVGEITQTSIAITVNATDDSGEIASYKYYLDGTLKDTLTTNSYIFTGLTEGTSYTIKVEAFDKANNKGENSTTATTTREVIPTTDSYVGYYADIEGDGTVDGIIYADLAKGNTGDGDWGGNGNGKYTIPIKTNLKDYYISKESYTDDFGTKDVLTPVEGQSGKNDRFYIMALDDIDESEHYWYYSATGNMSIDTDTAFETGKANTQTMISQWNSNKYPPQNDNDMWKLIQTQASKGWFVPSRAEWSAFGEELGITSSNYSEKGISDGYWSSSQSNPGFAWTVLFNNDYIYGGTLVANIDYVRLSTTF